MLDIVIRNGRIVDGSGLPAFRGDLGIAGGRIAARRRPRRCRAQTRDRRRAGSVVAPGLHRPAHPLRRAAPLGRPGAPRARARRHDGRARQLLALARAAQGRAPPEARPHVPADRGDARRGVRRRVRVDLGELRGLRRGAARPGRAERRAARGPQRDPACGSWATTRRSAPPRPTRSAPCRTSCARASRPAPSGLSTSYVDVDENLCPVPSRYAHHEEIDALAAVLGEFGRMLQVVPEFYSTDITIARVDQLAELSLRARHPDDLLAALRLGRDPRQRAARARARRGAVRARRARLAAGADPPDRHQLQPRHGEPLLRGDCRSGT